MYVSLLRRSTLLGEIMNAYVEQNFEIRVKRCSCGKFWANMINNFVYEFETQDNLEFL